jgi:chromosome partitioning protein
MAKVISFINYKGGVGKTTTTYHVGCSLAEHHRRRVLLLDIDPQTNLTFLCAPYERWRSFKSKNGTIASIYSRYQDQLPLDTKRYIWQTPVGRSRAKIQRLDLIPCDIELLGEDLGGGTLGGTYPTAEQLRRQARSYLREREFLKAIIKEVEEQYDFVLIDCPPNLYLMTQNALLASDSYVVTAIPDHLSTIGLNILYRKVGKIRELIEAASTFAGADKESCHVAEFGGVVFVKVRLGGSMITTTHQSTMAAVETLLGPGTCFSTWTTELIGYSDAAEQSLPIWQTDTPNARRAAAKGEYEEITEDFLRRFS